MLRHLGGIWVGAIVKGNPQMKFLFGAFRPRQTRSKSKPKEPFALYSNAESAA